MECAQINVTGGGAASPATVNFPGTYEGTDPGKEDHWHLSLQLASFVFPGIKINGGLELSEGDCAYAWSPAGGQLDITNIGQGSAEVLLYDLD